MRRIGVSEDRIRLLVNRVGALGGLKAERAGALVGLPVEWILDNDYLAVRDAA